MRKFIIAFRDDETMPERICKKALMEGISPEDLIARAINQYMGDFGLVRPPPGFKAKSLRHLFEAYGELKPGKE